MDKSSILLLSLDRWSNTCYNFTCKITYILQNRLSILELYFCILDIIMLCIYISLPIINRERTIACLFTSPVLYLLSVSRGIPDASINFFCQSILAYSNLDIRIAKLYKSKIAFLIYQNRHSPTRIAWLLGSLYKGPLKKSNLFGYLI